jgi:hypothetical protein
MNIQTKVFVCKLFAYIVLILAIYAIASFSTNAENYAYVSVGVGKNTSLMAESLPWEDGGGIAARFGVGYIWELNKRKEISFNFTHDSQWNTGPPVNNKRESSLDHFGLDYIYKFR